VARALRLNEDLVEAIGLGHDMGHTPFGHAGEEALDTALQERFGKSFRHNEQSLRIAESLNLTEEVRDGILTHTGAQEPATLEGKIVRIVDGKTKEDFGRELFIDKVWDWKRESGGTIGAQMRRIGETWWIILDAAETKSGRPDERPVPEILTAHIDDWLERWHPLFLEPGDDEYAWKQ
jgi:hypothetical protein